MDTQTSSVLQVIENNNGEKADQTQINVKTLYFQLWQHRNSFITLNWMRCLINIQLPMVRLQNREKLSKIITNWKKFYQITNYWQWIIRHRTIIQFHRTARIVNYPQQRSPRKQTTTLMQESLHQLVLCHRII